MGRNEKSPDAANTVPPVREFEELDGEEGRVLKEESRKVQQQRATINGEELADRCVGL